MVARLGHSFRRLKVESSFFGPNMPSRSSPFAVSDFMRWFVDSPSDCILTRVLCSGDNRKDTQWLMTPLSFRLMKRPGTKNENVGPKAEEETSSGEGGKPYQNSKPAEPPKQDYIHVRVRRGQATDSHSLAERARRERISERMKILQDLVPGCNKVMGKALVLDEIINYIQ